MWWFPPDAVASGDSQESAHGASEDQEFVLTDSSDRAKLYRRVFEKAIDTILIADDEARYVEVNPAACDLFGLPREQLLGRTIAEFAAEDYDVDEAWHDFRDDDLDRGLFPLRRADGEELIVEFSATPNVLPGLHLSVIRDVTERQRTKEQLAKERERAGRYQRSLTADTVIQIETQLDDDGLFAPLSTQFDCTCRFEGVVSTSDGRLLQYVTVEGADPTDAEAFVSESAVVQAHRIVFVDETTVLLECELRQSPVATVIESGGRVHSMHSDKGTTTLVSEVGADADPQGLLEALRGAYPGVAVLAKRTLDRPIVTTKQYRSSIAGRLTDRQREALRAAYFGGYFEWPRRSRAENIAASMGIATPTWLRHLRLAEGQLVDWFFTELDL